MTTFSRRSAVFLLAAALGLASASPSALAVPVTPLPDVVAGGPAAGIADEAKLVPALAVWQTAVNDFLQTLAPLDGDAAAELLLDEDGRFAALGDNEAIGQVSEAVQPMLDRFAAADFETGKLDAKDKALVAYLGTYGLEPVAGEGEPYLAFLPMPLMRRADLGPAGKAYLDQLAKQPARFFADGGCMYEVGEMAAHALAWERFLETRPAKVYAREAKRQWGFFVDYILLSTLPNTPAFRDGRMVKERAKELDAFVKAHPQSVTGKIAADFLAQVRKAGMKRTAKAADSACRAIENAFRNVR